MSNKNEPMKLVFTSFRDSIGKEGLKVSKDRQIPKLCSYPTLNYLSIPSTRHMSVATIERITYAVLDNDWNLLQEFITEMYDLGIRQIVFCCWCTKEQIANGKFCSAGIIGRYIMEKAERDGDFAFVIEVEYGDGREAL